MIAAPTAPTELATPTEPSSAMRTVSISSPPIRIGQSLGQAGLDGTYRPGVLSYLVILVGMYSRSRWLSYAVDSSVCIGDPDGAV